MVRGPAGRWVITDRSRNGTFVHGERISAATLEDGATIEIGHSFFLFRAAVPSTGAEPAVLRAEDLRPRSEGLQTLTPALQRQFQTIELVARSPLSVVLHGETGTGKELLARALHGLSGRSGAFVAVNCAAIPHALVESELFGYRKGAFSGATEDRLGLIRASDGGTLFLDEIGDLPLTSQAALLRVIQEREVTPIGGVKAIKVDLRIVSASHQDLAALVAEKRFRGDLESRLNGVLLTTVPLRERLEDLGLLVSAILARAFPAFAAEISFNRAAVRALLAHDWPKNVRELEQALVSATVLAGDGRKVRLEHLPPPLAGARRPATPDAADGLRAELRSHLEAAKGNVSAVAKRMGKSRRQIQRYLRKYALDPAAFR
jgi:transcriptional regulator with PAS, ATPase and Fis domain